MTNTRAAGAGRLPQAGYGAAIVLAPLILIPGTISIPGSAAVARALHARRPLVAVMPRALSRSWKPRSAPRRTCLGNGRQARGWAVEVPRKR